MRPILIIGLDGASFAVLEPLLAAGDLPTLGALGARAELASVVPPITPAAWASFMTGKHPGKHGIYDFHVYDPATRHDTFVTSRALREPTIWELLTAAGRRTGVLNLPMTYPPRPGAGTIVSGFDTPSTAVGFTQPPELRERLLARFPDYRFVAEPDPSDPTLATDAGFDGFVAAVEASIAQRTDAALMLLAEQPFDAFMVHYQDPDALQHQAWRFLADPDRHPGRAARLRETYRRLDAQLARLVAAMPGGSLVLVVSDHGFGSHDGRVYPNVLLREWGFLSWRGRRRDRLRRSVQKRLASLGLVRRDVKRAGPWITEARAGSFERALPLRWSRTRAYVGLAEIYGLLYLHLPAGASREALRGELRRRFLAVRDPHDGASVFADVIAGEVAYPDDPLGRRPDLVLVPRPGFSVHRGLNHRRWLDRYATTMGTHRPNGVLLAGGDGIRPGRLAGTPSLVDVAPTVLAAAGVPIPDDLDGRVLTELFVEPPEITRVPPPTRGADDGFTLSADDESEVMKRLQALGYMT